MAFMALCMLFIGHLQIEKKGEGRFKSVLLIFYFTALTGWVVEQCCYWEKFPRGPGLLALKRWLD